MIQQELLEAICCVVNLTVNKCCCCWVVNLTSTNVVVQSLSLIQLFVTPWTAARQVSLSFTISWLLKLMSIESMMSSNHIILCHPLLLLSSIFPRNRVFSSESVLHIRWPKYWSFSFNVSPSNEYSALMSLRMDWVDLLSVKGILKSLLQHHSSKASILRGLAFLMIQLWCLSSGSFFFLSFSFHRWHGSTELHSEWLLKPSCTALNLGPMLQKPTVTPQRKSPWHFLHHKSLSFFSYFFFYLSLFILSRSLRFHQVFISKLHIHIFESLQLESLYVWDLLYWAYPWNSC